MKKYIIISLLISSLSTAQIPVTDAAVVAAITTSHVKKTAEHVTTLTKFVKLINTGQESLDKMAKVKEHFDNVRKTLKEVSKVIYNSKLAIYTIENFEKSKKLTYKIQNDIKNYKAKNIDLPQSIKSAVFELDLLNQEALVFLDLAESLITDDVFSIDDNGRLNQIEQCYRYSTDILRKLKKLDQTINFYNEGRNKY